MYDLSFLHYCMLPYFITLWCKFLYLAIQASNKVHIVPLFLSYDESLYACRSELHMTFPERAVSIISITIPLTLKVSEHTYVNCDIACCDCIYFSLVDNQS